MFFVSVADKGLSVGVSWCKWFRINTCGWFVSVDNKGVKWSENRGADSAEEEVPEGEGRMDLSADRRLAEVPGERQMVQPRLVDGVRMVVEESGVLRLRFGWAK